MIRAGYIFMGETPCPADVSGYSAALVSWVQFHRHPEWFAELQAGGVELIAHYAASYFPGDPAATEGGWAFGPVCQYANGSDAWLRRDDGEIVVDGSGAHFYDMRASRGHAREIAKLGVVTYFGELEKRTGIMPNAVFLDVVHDAGPVGGIWPATKEQRADWARGIAEYLTTVAWNLRHKRGAPGGIYINGDTCQARLIDGVCYESYPVNGDYMAVMHEHGPAWARDNGLACLAVPANDGDMCYPRAWAVASACLAFEAVAGDGLVFDNGGAVFDVKGRLRK